MSIDKEQRSWVVRGLALAGLFVAAAGCTDILEVELPDALTEIALEDPRGATIQVNSVIGQIECGYTALTIEAAGYEDVFTAGAAVGSAYADYSSEPGEGNCDTSDSSANYFDALQIARGFGYGTYDRITNWSQAQLEDQDKEEMLALTALYIAVAIDVFGEHFCDIIISGQTAHGPQAALPQMGDPPHGQILSPAQGLDLAEAWVDRALQHIGAAGDFEGVNGSTTSVETMAYGLRARIRWANDDLAGAAADAARVPDGYVASATREGGVERRNKAFTYHQGIGYGVVLDVIDFWTGVQPNPVTGQAWPNPIPYTGYVDLAVTADGRAIGNDGFPITTATAGAVADPRVPLLPDQVAQGGFIGPFPQKWSSESEDIPIINWKEMRLIRAEAEPGQAVQHVNAVRADDDIAPVTYGPAAGEQTEDMINEERRRALWLEGRYWATKLRNTDKHWFPRLEGLDLAGENDLLGGVRLVYPEDEYMLNPNLTPNDRASGCDGGWEDQVPELGLGSSV